MTSQLETDASRSPAYPIAYFLCDGVTDAKTLKVSSVSITAFACCYRWRNFSSSVCRCEVYATKFNIL
jgi:hypothetical protein